MKRTTIGLLSLTVLWLSTTPEVLAGQFNAANTLQRLTKKLDLRPEQQDAVREILNIPAGHPHPCALELKEIDAIHKILTPDQRLRFAKLKEVKIARKRRLESCCPVP